MIKKEYLSFLVLKKEKILLKPYYWIFYNFSLNYSFLLLLVLNNNIVKKKKSKKQLIMYFFLVYLLL